MNKKALFLLLFLSLPLSLSALHLNLKVGMGGHRYSLYDVNYYKRNLTKWDPLYGATVELNFSRAFALETGAYLKKYRGDVELRFTDSTTGYIYKYKSKFDTKYELGYPLLADTDHAVAEAYGVWQEKQNYGKTYMGILRSAFLVGADGTLEQVWYKISPKDTPVKLLEALGR